MGAGPIWGRGTGKKTKTGGGNRSILLGRDTAWMDSVQAVTFMRFARGITVDMINSWRVRLLYASFSSKRVVLCLLKRKVATERGALSMPPFRVLQSF